MKEIRNEVLSIERANDLLGVEMEPGFWEALVRMISYPELTFDPGTKTIRYPGYVPFLDLAREWIEGIEQGIYDLRQCQRCAEYLDINESKGIFGNLPAREEFICEPCSRIMTAREYFDRYVARGDVY